MARTPEEISAADFKARCLRLMDQVEQERTEVIITKRGKPVAKLVPFTAEAPAVFGFMAGTGVIRDDIEAPIEGLWDADG